MMRKTLKQGINSAKRAGVGTCCGNRFGKVIEMRYLETLLGRSVHKLHNSNRNCQFAITSSSFIAF